MLPMVLQQNAKVESMVRDQNVKLESIAREQAKEHTRQLTSDRMAILISLGLAGLTILDNHYGFVSQFLATDFKVPYR
jgi:hypothetical protein